MCSASAGRTLSPADGHLAGRLRQEQARLLRLRRHAPTASRHSPASKPRVCLLGRHLVERRPLATRWPPPTSRRSCGSAAGAAGASRWHFLPLPLATGTSTHSCGHSHHTGKATTAQRVRACRCYAYRAKNPPLYSISLTKSTAVTSNVSERTEKLVVTRAGYGARNSPNCMTNVQ